MRGVARDGCVANLDACGGGPLLEPDGVDMRDRRVAALLRQRVQDNGNVSQFGGINTVSIS